MLFVLMILTVAESKSDLRICPLTFLVFVVKPLYSETPDIPSNAATALISAKEEKKILKLSNNINMCKN